MIASDPISARRISIDSYGWIERFTAGPKAAAYNRIIDKVEPADIVTSVVVIYEVYRKSVMMRGEQEALRNVGALRRTRIVPVDQEIALEAADHSLSGGLHFADALICATARRWNAELYTSDPALKGTDGVTLV